LVVVAFVIIITLGNFGISIAPLIALAGASALGAKLELQGLPTHWSAKTVKKPPFPTKRLSGR